ncbi:YncE family protein [Arthrobacter sp. ISL-72]|uniref:YncE family protein n=1 Tax=Arthrobacter sp. ISL-72 TaxID=2819114 RepID=UPI001BE6862B|nr:hypothetical protein [Arthrobacter sp. ISL-72]MBT2597215.1 hypothetical protein [Arthrobacter sp. ISL-72]
MVYSSDLGQVLVPARGKGLYRVDPAAAKATRVEYDGSADSVDAGAGAIFVLDRSGPRIQVLDPGGQIKSSVPPSARPDYLRYVAATREVWVTEPAKGGIEIFAVGETLDNAPHRTDFIPVPGGAEGLTLTSDGSTAYTHAGDEVAKIDTATRRVTARWPSGCDGTHGFPRIDERDGLVLASCAKDGKVTLLDTVDGHLIDKYELGGGESLPAYSAERDHFYVRSDPGTTVAVLEATPQGLKEVRKVQVPEAGHCLGAEGPYYWTCDAKGGRVLIFKDD